MTLLLVAIVFGTVFLELLDYLIILADLLVDGKQHGIEREHGSKHNP
jgi:hypothetical protein